jgi:hypothetical protein
MALVSLDNLVRRGQLKAEPPAQSELDGLIRSGLARLSDAENKALSLDSRFDLAYNAAHALSPRCAGTVIGRTIVISCSRRLRIP